jgi:hypothetical protein
MISCISNRNWMPVTRPLRYCLILFLTASLIAGTNPTTSRKKHSAKGAQMEPSLERIAEIQSALKAHGYEPGSTWKETQEVCRKIADEHMWQTDHAPDARVLILLGLAGPHADPAVAQMHGDRLDKDQRAEAARRNQNVTASTLRPSDDRTLQRAPKPDSSASISKAAASGLSTNSRDEPTVNTPRERKRPL